jgi:hypothetical protein
MMTFEEIVNLITSDLKLDESDKKDFIDLFMELTAYNVLLAIPEQYKTEVGKILVDEEGLKDQNKVSESLKNAGISKELAAQIIEDSIRKSTTEVVEKYSAELSNEAKQQLQGII